jgi:nicotinamide-nucleotide amidase
LALPFAGEGVERAARELFEALSARNLVLACAESCTGGLLTAALTDIPGSSKVLWGGVVSYSNECKEKLLGVSPEILSSKGAVSKETARAMAEGALRASGADIALSITGIAGPDGGSAEKPVGLVCFAWRSASGSGSEAQMRFQGDRRRVREAAVEAALAGALSLALGIDEAAGGSAPV